KNIREQGLKSVTEVMDLLGWETVGCEKCRPAINYYVSMVDPLHAVDDISSRLVNERTHANIQADGTFSVVPRMYGGVVSAEELKRIAEAAVKYDVPLVKVTGGQRIDLLGVKKDDLPKMWKDIDMPSGFAYAKGLRTVKTCVGEKYCRYGTRDSLGLGVRMERFFEGLWMPAKVKMAVTGCPRNCAESLIKDLGVVGINGGFEIYVGGSGGIVLKGGKLLCTVETSEEVLQTAASFMQFYREDAEYGERTYKWVRRVGLEVIKDTLAKDGVGLAERLNDARDVVKEPWGVGVKASGE
ncbi:MAG: NAD(P)/FAD-dependent oxidoreductase, partial [Deltaproteobacteria bacterium]|nr:NAD(P)/FAD-dependent oxidoreductase [Deltaproteobacteria bacterium]